MSYLLDMEEEDEAEEKRRLAPPFEACHTEILAMQHILDELDGDEGLLVALGSDEAGITRSVIVNALQSWLGERHRVVLWV